MEKNSMSRIDRFYKKSQVSPIPLLLPLIIILGALFIYPMIEVFRYSFTNLRFGNPDYSYTFSSYFSIFSDKNFFNVLKITAIFVFFSVFFQLLNGFIVSLAIYMGEKLKVKGSIFVRTSVIVSMAIPGVIIGVIWTMIFDESPSGIVNYYLSLIGIEPVRFLTNPNIALVSIVIANVWRGTATNMILMYAGLKTLPDSILEAASVDGANDFIQVTKIIIPYIRPIILISGLLSVIGTFNTFDMIMSLTGGGPAGKTEVLALNSYMEIFKNFNLGKGSVIAVIILLINLIMAAIYFRINKKGEQA